MTRCGTNEACRGTDRSPRKCHNFQACDLVSSGGGRDFGSVIRLCESAGEYCPIGDLAVNCYVDPVYTMDTDLVAVLSSLPQLSESLCTAGFQLQSFEHSLNAQIQGSDLRIQFITYPRYQNFPLRAVRRNVLGVEASVASLEDVTRGKLWAFSDLTRRRGKRKKDELDLLRLAEAFPELRSMFPADLLAMFEGD